jgi:hypothetical protein
VRRSAANVRLRPDSQRGKTTLLRPLEGPVVGIDYRGRRNAIANMAPTAMVPPRAIAGRPGIPSAPKDAPSAIPRSKHASPTCSQKRIGCVPRLQRAPTMTSPRLYAMTKFHPATQTKKRPINRSFTSIACQCVAPSAYCPGVTARLLRLLSTSIRYNGSLSAIGGRNNVGLPPA